MNGLNEEKNLVLGELQNYSFGKILDRNVSLYLRL